MLHVLHVLHVYLCGNDVRVGGNEGSEQRSKGFLLVRLDTGRTRHRLGGRLYTDRSSKLRECLQVVDCWDGRARGYAIEGTDTIAERERGVGDSFVVCLSHWTLTTSLRDGQGGEGRIPALLAAIM